MVRLLGLIANPFYLITAFAFVLLVMLLMLMPLPRATEWRPFRRSLNYVKVAYAVMLALNIFQCLDPESPPHEYRFYVIIIASYQALFFTMFFRRLLNPCLTLRKFLMYFAGVTMAAAVVLLVHLLWHESLCPVTYWIYLAAYVAMSCHYTCVCYLGWKEAVVRLAEYYDEDMAERMHWFCYLTWTVFGVGIMALATSIWVELNPVFVLVYTIAYAYFLVCIVRYAFSAHFIVTRNARLRQMSDIVGTGTAMQGQMSDAAGEATQVHSSQTCGAVSGANDESVNLDEREEQLALALRRWVEEKQFTKSDEAVENIARQLGTTYRALSSYFQKHEGITFREWRTRLRVEEAKRLLHDDMSLSVSEVLDMSGFNDRANFYRHFTRIVGSSPSAYRASLTIE